MHEILANLVKSFEKTGDIEKDVGNFLEMHGFYQTAKHSIQVGYESKRLARDFGVDQDSAAMSGFLHDISAVFPNNERINVSNELGIEVLPEEETFPLIIHQKISRVMAKEIFHINEELILDAISCHTTLRANSTTLDRVLFVADKIEWDQKGTPPYIEELKNQLNISLEHGAFSYIKYLWEQRESLKVVHPWLADAYFELKYKLNL
ncbi:bis(5'-nucleosyl)-tetraphosphatase (symmetrical) YqeK [Caldalkalibacillus salinus]|uniref:bis(5'-nucleosyl)-tetraphosphatase (symmetrical) YqeK n=1 Tax=Caldalkalibacillus salinus TaxID=2803787 RepID=UPI001F2DED22|nr:bis(5'-nucleosyl)-tetraphosphatase (symmetrical) YqeK [Caldalkalibacillus salinus]